jgi:hypothetical protein
MTRQFPAAKRRTRLYHYNLAARPTFNESKSPQAIISHLVSRFEKSSLSRRELVCGQVMLAASGAARHCPRGLDFNDPNIDRVSIHVTDLQDFYQKMFGFSVVSQDQAGRIIRLSNTKVLSLSQPSAMVTAKGHKSFVVQYRAIGHHAGLRLA